MNKVLEILMQRIAFCSLAVPTLAGWVTTSVPGSWIWAQKETPSFWSFLHGKRTDKRHNTIPGTNKCADIIKIIRMELLELLE